MAHSTSDTKPADVTSQDKAPRAARTHGFNDGRRSTCLGDVTTPASNARRKRRTRWVASRRRRGCGRGRHCAHFVDTRQPVLAQPACAGVGVCSTARTCRRLVDAVLVSTTCHAILLRADLRRRAVCVHIALRLARPGVQGGVNRVADQPRHALINSAASLDRALPTTPLSKPDTVEAVLLREDAAWVGDVCWVLLRKPAVLRCGAVRLVVARCAVVDGRAHTRCLITRLTCSTRNTITGRRRCLAHTCAWVAGLTCRARHAGARGRWWGGGRVLTRVLHTRPRLAHAYDWHAHLRGRARVRTFTGNKHTDTSVTRHAWWAGALHVCLSLKRDDVIVAEVHRCCCKRCEHCHDRHVGQGRGCVVAVVCGEGGRRDRWTGATNTTKQLGAGIRVCTESEKVEKKHQKKHCVCGRVKQKAV